MDDDSNLANLFASDEPDKLIQPLDEVLGPLPPKDDGGDREQQAFAK
jgi:hypothetical protein